MRIWRRLWKRIPFITEIGIDLEDEWEEGEGQQAPDWSSLLRVIATRANLENVKLEDAVDPEERTAPAALGSLHLASNPAEQCHTNSGVALAPSFHRYFYFRGHRIFNHILQPL